MGMWEGKVFISYFWRLVWRNARLGRRRMSLCTWRCRSLLRRLLRSAGRRCCPRESSANNKTNSYSLTDYRLVSGFLIGRDGVLIGLELADCAIIWMMHRHRLFNWRFVMFSNLRFCWFIVRSVNVERDILQNNIVLLNDRLCRCRVVYRERWKFCAVILVTVMQ